MAKLTKAQRSEISKRGWRTRRARGAAVRAVMARSVARRRNPGAAWHKKEYLIAERKARVPGSPVGKPYESGFAAAHLHSELVAERLGIPNPLKRKPKTRRSR